MPDISLKNFDTLIDSALVRRGRKYFEDGAVAELDETEPGRWDALVSGTEDYEVEIRCEKDKIIAVSCDCPHDALYCKHVIAVLYNIRETPKNVVPEKRKTEQKKKMNFDKLLDLVEEGEIRNFIKTCAEEDREFKQRFLLHFSHKDPNTDAAAECKKMIDQIIRSHSSRGFMDYRQTFTYSKEIQKVFSLAETAVRNKNYIDAVALATLLAKNNFDLLQNCDDSAGNIGALVSSSIGIFRQVAGENAASPDLKDKIYIILEEFTLQYDWFDYGDFGYEILDIAHEIALNRHPDRFLLLLNKLILQTSREEYGEYRKSNFIRQKIDFLKALGKSEEAIRIMRENMDDDKIRKVFVEEALAEKNYGQAKSIIAQGIEIADQKKHPGTVRQWEEMLYEISIAEKDIALVRHFAKKFALESRFNLEYYNALKASYGLTEWKTEVEKILQERIAEGREFSKKYKYGTEKAFIYVRTVDILIEEQYFERLYESLPEKLSLHELDRVADYLKPLYPEQIFQKYLNILSVMGDAASDRSKYAELAKEMKKVSKAFPEGRPAVLSLVAELMEKYPRRPAMLEELRAVIGKKG